jgi:hypothetical protein
MTKLKGYWARISLAILTGLFLSFLLLALGRNPLYGLILAVIFGVWLTQPASPSDGRKAGAIIGVTSATLLALASFIQPAVGPLNALLGDSWIEALLSILLLSLACAVYGDIAIRFRNAYSQGKSLYF